VIDVSAPVLDGGCAASALAFVSTGDTDCFASLLLADAAAASLSEVDFVLPDSLAWTDAFDFLTSTADDFFDSLPFVVFAFALRGDVDVEVEADGLTLAEDFLDELRG